MKKLFTLAATLLTLSASAAMAQSGLNLYWDNCSPSGVQSKTFACNTNTGAAFGMYASVVIQADMPAFLGTTAIIDFTIENGTTPAWWQTRAGECRANSLGMSFDPNGFVTDCVDIWGGAPPLSILDIQPGIHGGNSVRMNGGAVVPAGSEISLTADGTEMVVCKVTINRAKTVGAGLCDGCLMAVCIVLNECKLQQPGGVGDQTITNELANRWLTWNGTPSNCPAGTPTMNRTWGAVKNLYR